MEWWRGKEKVYEMAKERVEQKRRALGEVSVPLFCVWANLK